MQNVRVRVHSLSSKPDEAWAQISKTKRCRTINCFQIPNEKPVNCIRFVCMSDTHLGNFKFDIPNGDVFLHAGDFTNSGLAEEVKAFNNWLKDLPHLHKIVIAGNHELSFDDTCIGKFDSNGNIKQFLTNCIYLEDSGIEVYGIKIYGSPWQPTFRNGAFGAQRGRDILRKWNKIPADTDILLTHGPPLGYGDKTARSYHVGCTELLTTIQERVKPKYSIYGHIHEDYGIKTDGNTYFINASTCNQMYVPKNVPIVFDYPLPAGINKPI